MSSPTEKFVGFAVLGLGMGKHHVHCIRKAPGTRLVGVCDIREEKRAPVAEQAGCKAWTSIEEMLQDPEVEVVNIALPSGMHSDAAVQAARAGKHVLCEKPLDVTLEKIDAMVKACKEAGVLLGGIFQRRTSPLYQVIRQVVAEGRLGRLVLADVSVRWYREQSYYDGDGGWRGTWQWDGGGSLMNQGVHSVDILSWIAGPVQSVCAHTAVLGHSIETEDVVAATLQFASGALGTITTTTSAYPGLYEDLNLHGMKGSIRVEDGQLKTCKLRSAAGGEDAGEESRLMKQFGAAETGSGSADPMAVGLEGHTALIADMAAAVREGREPMITGEEGRKAVEIITAIYTSAREGRPVALRDG